MPHTFAPAVLGTMLAASLALSGTEAAMFERFSPFSGRGPEKTSLEIWKCGGKPLIFAAGFSPFRGAR